MGYYSDLKEKRQEQSGVVEDPRYAPFQQQTESAGFYGEMKRRIQREKQKADEKGVDLDTGGDFWDRMAAGIKITPQGRLGYLQSKFGEDNVRFGGDGEMEFLRSPQERWIRFDEDRLNIKDVADLSGDVIEALLSVAGGAATKSPAGAALGAFGGNLLRQGLSELIPGDEGMDITDRASTSAMSALLGAGSQYGANKLFNLLDKARPHNLARPIMITEGDSRTAMVGQRLMQQTGVDLRKDQLTGNPTAQMIMGLMRRHPSTAKMVKEQELGQLAQLRSYLDKTMDAISSGKIGKERAATRATAAYEGYVKNLGETMSRVGGQMFDDVWKLTERLPEKRIMKIGNTIDEWKKIIEDFDTPLGSDTATKIIDHAQKQIELIEANGGVLNPKQFQRSMSIFGKASAGTGDIVKDVKDRSVQRSIAARISKALNKDLDATVEGGGVPGEIGEKLKAARDYYKTAATEIDDVSNSILANTVGEPGEETVRKMLRSYAPSEVRDAMTLMQRVSPDAANGMKRAAIQEILDQSKPSGSASVIGGVGFSPQKLITNATKADKHMRAMFAATDDMQGYVSWKRAVKVAQRIADHAGMDGSPTAPLQWTMSLVKSFAGHAWPFDYRGMAADVAAVLAPRTLQKAMLTNQGRQALFEVTKTGNNVRNVAQAVAYLKSLDLRDE